MKSLALDALNFDEMFWRWVHQISVKITGIGYIEFGVSLFQ